MRFIIRVQRAIDPASRAVLELETGIVRNSWRMSGSDWSISVGSSGSGTWQYYEAHVLYGQTITGARIALFEGRMLDPSHIGTLYVDRYPPQVGDRGQACITVAQVPGVLESYDTQWERTS